MKIEELIQLHNEALNRKVQENIFLNQRIKARLKDRKRGKQRGMWLALRKPVLVYSFLLIIFTVLNFILIDGLKKRDTRLAQPPVLTLNLNLNTLQPTFPGSITHAYAEVMK
jgi:hypothetical protein